MTAVKEGSLLVVYFGSVRPSYPGGGSVFPLLVLERSVQQTELMYNQAHPGITWIAELVYNQEYSSAHGVDAQAGGTQGYFPGSWFLVRSQRFAAAAHEFLETAA
eukprot:CAMPEP_0174372556 /NCGR_PEP_ID=MMETSP0811_2-20130205/104057_1 /TAXON_ID=73025 ORGANISM="Eutreptiella gymnastica-like, Strain CCMP1594" /NCGR_SAMPLE_ID=MMETSP0811_2 /ASSEMBLY_ACC=CAM_ASM_000667 /LENGTH=104 /DNA_ID=CAMNT_0015520097 /DNA_START=560 /DNA_END=874 /DNA_ORIENTATION=-